MHLPSFRQRIAALKNGVSLSSLALRGSANGANDFGFPVFLQARVSGLGTGDMGSSVHVVDLGGPQDNTRVGNIRKIRYSLTAELCPLQ